MKIGYMVQVSHTSYLLCTCKSRAEPGGGGGAADPDQSHEKSQVDIGFLRITDTDPPREAIGPFGPIASRGRPVRPSVKYVDDSINAPSHTHTPDGICWIRPCKSYNLYFLLLLVILNIFMYYTPPRCLFFKPAAYKLYTYTFMYFHPKRKTMWILIRWLL